MADCLQSKYTYKGKEYTLEELANRFAEGELAKLASDGVVDLSDFKRGKKNAFAKNLQGVEVKPKTEQIVVNNEPVKATSSEGKPIETTTNKISSSFEAGIQAAEAEGMAGSVMVLDENGNYIPAKSLKNSKGETTWDAETLDSFAKALNKSFEGTSDKKVKLVATDANGFETLFEAYYGEKPPAETQSFVDKKKGLIVINGDKASATAPLHEAAHLWLPWAKEFSPDLYEVGMKVIKESSEYKNLEELVKNYKKGKVEELGEWESYVKRAAEMEPKKMSEFLASEVLARATEKQGEVNLPKGLKEQFKDWYNQIIDLIKEKFGLSKTELKDIKDFKLGDLAKAVKQEILSDEKFTKIGESAKEKREKRLEEQNRKAQTEFDVEEGMSRRKAGKTIGEEVEIENAKKAIKDTDAVDVLKNQYPSLYKKAIKAIADSGMIKEKMKEMGKTAEGVAQLDQMKANQASKGVKVSNAIAENILNEILAKKSELPTSMGKFGGRNPAGSGLIKDLYAAIGEAYGVDAVTAMKNINPTMVAEKTITQEDLAVEGRKLETRLTEVLNQIKELETLPNTPENKKQKEALANEFFRVRDAIEKNENLRAEAGVTEWKGDSDLEFADDDGFPELKVGKNKINKPMDIPQAQEEIKKAGWAKWHFWSKDAIIGKPAAQALSKLKGRVSSYKRENLIVANDLIVNGQEFIREFNSRNPQNKINGKQLSSLLDKALKGDKAAYDVLNPKLQNLITTMRSNIDALSLSYIETGNLTYADMDTYNDNLGKYVANVYEKYATEEPTSFKYKITKSLKESLAKQDNPLANLIKSKIDVSTDPPWLKNLTKEQREAAMSGLSDMVDNGYFDTDEMIKNGTAFKQELNKVFKLDAEAVNVAEELSSHELDKPASTTGQEYTDWDTKKKDLVKQYTDKVNDYVEALDKYNKRKFNQVEYQFGEITKRAEDKGSIISVTNKMNWKRFSQRQDIPQWYKDIIGESNDVFKNYFLTIGKLQNGHSIMMMQDEILNIGLKNGMIEEQGKMITPANKNYVVVGGQHSVTGTSKSTFGPLSGYKMHPDLYKVMFELPVMQVDNVGWKSMKGAFLESANWVNRMKIVYNPTSLYRNFTSHFGNDLMLAGFYTQAMGLSRNLINGEHNMFHLGMDHYGGNMKEYFAGLTNDGAKYGATNTIAEQEFNRLFKDITSEKDITKAFDKSSIKDGEAPIKSMVNATFKMFKYVPKGLRKGFFLGDYLPKLAHFEVMRNSIAYKAYGDNFYLLTPEQMDACSNAAARCVTQDMATPELAGEMANIQYLGIVPKYTYEMARTRYQSMKNAIGHGILENYSDIKWSNNQAENDAIIGKLSKAHRLRKTLGLAQYSMSLYTSMIIGNAVFDKAKRIMNDEAQGILVVGDSGGKESNMFDEMLREALTTGDNITNQQAVRNIVEPYLRTHNLYAEYDPETYTMKYWDAGRNDMYAQFNGVFRGFMYDVAPTQYKIPFVTDKARSMAANEPGLTRGLATLTNQAATFYGTNIMTKALTDPLFDEQVGDRVFKNATTSGEKVMAYTKAVGLQVIPSDATKLINTMEGAYKSEKDFETQTKDGTTKYFKDNFIEGLNGTYKEVNVRGKIAKNVYAEARNMEADIRKQREEYSKDLNRLCFEQNGKSFNELSKLEKYNFMNQDNIKDMSQDFIENINEKARLAAKNMKTWYITAQKFNFKEADLRQIFENPQVLSLDLGDTKNMPAFRTQRNNETFRNVLNKSFKDIEKLDFNSLYNDKTYYITK